MTLPTSTSFNTRSVASQTGRDSEYNSPATSVAKQQGQMAGYKVAQTKMPSSRALPEAKDGLSLSSCTGQVRERQVASTSDQTSESSLAKADTKPIAIDRKEYLRNLSVLADNPMLNCAEVELALNYIDKEGELPPLSDAVILLTMPCMKKGWSGDDQAVENNPIDLTKLMRFSTTFTNQGIETAISEAKDHFLRLITYFNKTFSNR